MILIDSIHINNSGGKVLLNYLVDNLRQQDTDYFYLFDKRCTGEFEYLPYYQRNYLKGSLLAREEFYRKYGNCFDKILCFSNIPPPSRSKGRVYTFFQNVLLAESCDLLAIKARTVLQLKQRYIEKHLKNTDFIIVQTKHVKEVFLLRYKFPAHKIVVLPFFQDEIRGTSDILKDPLKFIFVSDGNIHKNHSKLLEAWQIINEKEPSLQLHLTVSGRYPFLVKLIEDYRKKGMSITNHGTLRKEDLIKHYKGSTYLIYPSTMESFGLGLIEGLQYNCKVIAANQPYVHAICHPLAVFDESNAKSIAACVLSVYKERSGTGHFTPSTLIIKNEINELLQILK